MPLYIHYSIPIGKDRAVHIGNEIMTTGKSYRERGNTVFPRAIAHSSSAQRAHSSHYIIHKITVIAAAHAHARADTQMCIRMYILVRFLSISLVCIYTICTLVSSRVHICV